MARTNLREKKEPDFCFFVRLNKNQNTALKNRTVSKKEIEQTANDRLSNFIAAHFKEKYNLDATLKQISSMPDEDSRCSLQLQGIRSLLVDCHLSDIFLESLNSNSESVELELTTIMRACIKGNINSAINSPYNLN